MNVKTFKILVTPEIGEGGKPVVYLSIVTGLTPVLFNLVTTFYQFKMNLITLVLTDKKRA